MPIWLTIDTSVKTSDATAFEVFVRQKYLPTLATQTGFVRGHLLRTFDDEYLAKIEATSDGFRYRLEFGFDSEAQRLDWVRSPAHAILWPEFQGYCEYWKYCGYDVLQSSPG